MKHILYLLIYLFSTYQARAQDNQESIEEWIKVLSYGVSNQTNESFFTLEEAVSRSNQCIPATFRLCKLTLSNNTTHHDVWLKYDFRDHIVLIKMDDIIHVAAPNFIKEFIYSSPSASRKFINVAEMGRTFGKQGFYEILEENEIDKLVRYRSFKSITPDYNKAMDVGEKEVTYSKQEEILIFKNRKAQPLNNFGKKNLSLLDADYDLLKSFIKERKLKYKDNQDLISFAQYYWSL